jgi:hypothetical protein
MSYRDYLQKRIGEVENNIRNNVGEKESLEKELKKLEMQEFEEDLREQGEQRLLKG